MELKISVLIILITVSNALATRGYSQVAKVSLDMKNTSLEQVMDKIEGQSEFYFIFNQKQIDVNRTVDIHVENKLITDILPELFKGTNVNYVVFDRKILLTTDPLENRLLAIASGPELQQKRITGTVTNKDGVPLPGVNVVVTGTTQGEITDVAGKYSIEVPQGAKNLTFSFVGMETKEITIGILTQIDVTMAESAIGLNEVVVIGFGSRKRATLTGAISSVKGDILRASTSNMVSGLAGQLPGVIINTRSSQPGQEQVEIYLRGKYTFGANNSPIVVTEDGSPAGNLARINPDDIESITLLKDASAAIYGVNAANGVILLKMKRGTAGKPTINFTSNFTYSQPTITPNWTTNLQSAIMSKETYDYRGSLSPFSAEDIKAWENGSDPYEHPNVDWYNETFRSFSPQQRYNISMNGGTEGITYFVSAEYLDQKSLYRKGYNDACKFNQYQVRANLDMKITNNFKVSTDLFAQNRDVMSPFFTYGSTMLEMKVVSPKVPATYPNGDLGPVQNGYNPLILGSKIIGYDLNSTIDYAATLRFNWNLSPILKGLGLMGYYKYSGSSGYNKHWKNSWFVYGYDKSTETYYPIPGGQTSITPELYEQSNRGMNYLTHLRLTYARSFGKHTVDAFVAQEAGEGSANWFRTGRFNFKTNLIEELPAGDATTAYNDGSASESGGLNYFGRVSYGYDEKYLIDMTMRADGSYKFAKGHQWGYFPSVSAAWRVSEEPFFKNNVSFMSNLKIRASYGLMGNDNTAAFQYLAMYTSSQVNQERTYLGESGLPVPGMRILVYPNPALTWEKQRSINIGLDASLFKDLIDFSFDAFHNKRSQILVTRAAALPVYYGIPLPSENIGIVNSYGVEAQLGFNKKLDNGMVIFAKTNFTFARNRVEYMAEAQGVQAWQKKEGHSVDVLTDYALGQTDYYNSFYSRLLFVADGLFQNQKEIDDYPHFAGTGPGDIKYIDTNEDGKIDGNDRVRFNKSATPEIVYGINLGTTWKGWELSLNLQGQARAWAIQQPNNGRIDEVYFTERWQKEGDNQYPRSFNTFENNDVTGVNFYRSTFWLRSAAFLRIKGLELAYNIPAELLKKTNSGLQGVRVFVNGSNLYVFDSYDTAQDPEIDVANNQTYPLLRTYNFGFSLRF